MYQILLIFTLSLSTFSQVQETDALKLLDKAQRSVQNPLLHQAQECCVEDGLSQGVIETKNGKAEKITLVSEGEANSIFQEMVSIKDIPFQYIEDGCYARAHEIVKYFENKGIIFAKVFIVDAKKKLRVNNSKNKLGYVEWWFHVAPVILVSKNGKSVPYVFDPSIYNKPVPVDEWKSIQTRHVKKSKADLYFTNRFVYRPDNAKKNLLAYIPQEMNEAHYLNRLYSQALKENGHL